MKPKITTPTVTTAITMVARALMSGVTPSLTLEKTTIGSVFNDVISLVEGAEHLIPTEHNVEEFIDWVHAHDLFQAADFPTDMFGLQDAAKGLPPNQPPHELATLPREFVLQLHANPNLSLGGGVFEGTARGV